MYINIIFLKCICGVKANALIWKKWNNICPDCHMNHNKKNLLTLTK